MLSRGPPQNRNLYVKPAAPPVGPLSPPALAWLLVALALAVAPHARELPVWLAALFAAIPGWRWIIAMRDRAEGASRNPR